MSSPMDTDQPAEGKIDESLYSRQLYVLGEAAMKKMNASNILICGLKGLGVEIAKNVILGGVKSVVLYDPSHVEIQDLSSQFFLNTSMVGKPTAHACAGQLQELNQYVPVTVHNGELDDVFLAKFTVVVVTEASIEERLRINDYTHSNNIKYVSVRSNGLFGNIFADFGENFEVVDVNGEQAKSCILSHISQEEEGVVTCSDEVRHGLDTGDWVTFSEVKGMSEVNSMPPVQIKVLGPYSFSIGDTRAFGTYEPGCGGVCLENKKPSTIHFKSYRDAMADPEFVITDWGKMERPALLHAGFEALDKFKRDHGRLPRPRNAEDAKIVVALAAHANTDELSKSDQDLLKEMAYQSTGDLAPINAVIGGLAAQEIMKACSGKFNPIKQFLYFDATECIPENVELTEEDCKPVGSRYDGYYAVFGKSLHNKLQTLKVFLVGAGAIGCEMLKNWALMGVAGGEGGCITVTDMDTIEKSNLNRQFLFRPHDVSKFKSNTAATAVQKMNPDINIIPSQDRVGVETEHIFTDRFFDNLDLVTNALDNVDARRYVDLRCVYYRKPLLESGTLGTKGNTQVILPFLTESYSSSQDPPEKSIPICTLKNFPNAIEHTIQWARDSFEDLFFQQCENVNQYLTNLDFCDQLEKLSISQQTEVVESLKANLGNEKPATFDDCIVWARLKFEEYFNNSIAQLLFNFPPDQMTSSGTSFWSAPKRCPKPLVFDSSEPLHLDFIVASANLRAANYGLNGSKDTVYIKSKLSDVMVPEFAPKSGVKIQVDSNETPAEEEADASHLEQLLTTCPKRTDFVGLKVFPADFEKDDDRNFHIDFVTAMSNLRASNYGIMTVDRFTTKGIAGKIIPAIATTTSAVTGLVCLEMLKVAFGIKDIEKFKNGFVNLALPFVGFSEPVACAKVKALDKEYSLWDRFDIQGPMTLQQFLDFYKKETKLDITMMSCGVSMIYSFFMNAAKRKERLGMDLQKVVEDMNKKPIAAHQEALVFEVCVSNEDDDDDDDIDVPYVRYILK
eukprot:CFRG4779T1